VAAAGVVVAAAAVRVVAPTAGVLVAPAVLAAAVVPLPVVLAKQVAEPAWIVKVAEENCQKGIQIRKKMIKQTSFCRQAGIIMKAKEDLCVYSKVTLE
jgi:hypothetical protein